MVEAKIDIFPSDVIGTIDPKVYGHFIEHIGGVIYDGIWVGEDSKIPNVKGIREDIITHLKQIKAPIIRWPGGCFADRYHWQDGIGPLDTRPRRYGRWKESIESNHFGTHEFMKLCQIVGAEPYIAANVGTGSVEEFQQWLEYNNAPNHSTTLADLRQQNGAVDPFTVRYWGVGNESWGCGGNFTPEDYCNRYRNFVTWVPSFGLEPVLIGCGPSGNDLNWTRRFFKALQDYRRAKLHGWAAHYYCGTAGTALEYTNDQWYELLHKGAYMETLIQDQWNTLAEYDSNHNVKLVIDEWGCWHPPGSEINPNHLYEQISTLRDAMVAAITLDIFNRHCDKVMMANIAQLVNNLHSLFLADGPKFFVTPNFHVYDMYKAHQNASCVRTVFKAPEIEFASNNLKRKIFGLAGSASVKDKKLTLTVVNPHVEKSIETRTTIKGYRILEGRSMVLSHKNIHAYNTFEKPDEVVPRHENFKVKGSTFTNVFPPASINLFELLFEHE